MQDMSLATRSRGYKNKVRRRGLLEKGVTKLDLL